MNIDFIYIYRWFSGETKMQKKKKKENYYRHSKVEVPDFLPLFKGVEYN